METKTNKELLERLIEMSGQLALAQNWHEPRKEKRYEREVERLRIEILERLHNE